MFERLSAVESRFLEINELLSDPEVVSDNERFRTLMKEHKGLAPVVEKFREYKKAKADADEARELLNEGGLDADFKEMVRAQLEDGRAAMERCEEELKILLLPRDENDDKNVIVEIRGGAGGEEAALFANSLYRMYTMYADTRRWRVEVVNSNETELGGRQV